MSNHARRQMRRGEWSRGHDSSACRRRGDLHVSLQPGSNDNRCGGLVLNDSSSPQTSRGGSDLCPFAVTEVADSVDEFLTYHDRWCPAASRIELSKSLSRTPCFPVLGYVPAVLCRWGCLHVTISDYRTFLPVALSSMMAAPVGHCGRRGRIFSHASIGPDYRVSTIVQDAEGCTIL